MLKIDRDFQKWVKPRNEPSGAPVRSSAGLGRWKVAWKHRTGCTKVMLCGTVDDLIDAVLQAVKEPEHAMTIQDLKRKRPNAGAEPPAN